MRSVAAGLSGEDRAKVSRYYAALSIASPSRPNAGPQAGQALYLQGEQTRGLAPCASCHGEQGEGSSAANPPLALQPAAYLAAQLRAWKRGERQNDPRHVMLQISQKLSDDEITALANFAAALPGAPPPSFPEASR